MWAATLAVVVLRTYGANFNTGVGTHDGAAGSVFPGTQLRINHAAFGTPSDLQMSEKELEQLSGGDTSVHGSRKDCVPDCTNCREPGMPSSFIDRRGKNDDPAEVSEGTKEEETDSEPAKDEQCCIGEPKACRRCSEIIPESFYRAVGNKKITGTWRVTRCENNEQGGKCDPCKPDRSTEYEGSRELYCSESEDAGRLMCYPRTPEEFQIKCNPGSAANAWYGGWEVKDKDLFRSCLQR